MQIELRNLDVRDYIPYKLYDFTARIVIDGDFICDAHNGPQKYGDIQFSNIVSGGKEKLKEADQEAHLLPPKPFIIGDMFYKMGMNIHHHIEDLIISIHDPNKMERDKMKFKELIEQGIVVGQPGAPVETFQLVQPPEYTKLSTIINCVDPDKLWEHLNWKLRYWRNEGIDLKVLNTNLSKVDIENFRLERYMSGKTIEELYPVNKEKEILFRGKTRTKPTDRTRTTSNPSPPPQKKRRKGH